MNSGDSGGAMVIRTEDYPVLACGGQVAETIRQNLGGEQVTAADLTRIRVPAGGGLAWTIEGADETSKVLEGIVIHIARRRAYWPNANPTGEPPACTSTDMLRGVGSPGGDCEACPFNQFGSKSKPDGTAGRGKACKETKLIFLVRTGQLLPDIVMVPPTSLKSTRQFQLKLGVPYWSVLTRLTLEKAQSKEGFGYSEIRCGAVATLAPEMAAQMRSYAQSLGKVFEAAMEAAVNEEEPQSAEI